MEIRELHKIATMYTNIAEALSFANDFKPKDTTINLKEIKVNTNNGAKRVRICLLYEYKDFEREEIFDFDVNYMRSTMVNDICTDVARFVKECENE